jgi:hypothetical protein
VQWYPSSREKRARCEHSADPIERKAGHLQKPGNQSFNVVMSNSFPGLLGFLSRGCRVPEGYLKVPVMQATKGTRTLSKAQ